MSVSLNKKTGKAVAWSSVTEIMAKLVSPIVNMVLARLLTPEAFGAVATITMIITFAELFTDAGFQKYIVQHEFSSEDELDKNTNVAFWTNFVLSAVIVGLIVLFRDPLATLVGSPDLGGGIAVSSFIILLVAFSSIQTARFRRDLNFKPLFFVRIGSTLIPLVVTVPLAFTLKSYWALVVGNLAVNLFNAVVLTVKSKWKPKLFYSFGLLREMFAFSVWTLLESILIWLTANVDIFVVGSVLDNYYLGLYKTSMTTVNSYMTIITAAVTPVLFSTLSRYQNDEVNFRSTYLKFQKYVAVLVIPMSAGIFIFRNFVTDVLLGSQWGEAAEFVGLWGLISGIAIVFATFSSEVYRSKGNPKLSMLAQALHLIVLIPAVMLAVNSSYEVLYIVRALVRLQFILVHIILICSVYKFNFLMSLKNMLPAFISTAAMSVVGIVLEMVSTSILLQIISVLVCIVVYFAVLLIAFPKTRKEIFEIEVVSKTIAKIKKRP